MKKLISTVMLSSLLLGACSEEAVKEDKPVEAKAETKEEAADQVKKDRAEIARAQETANSSQYAKQVSSSMMGLSDKLTALTNQTKKMTDNPYITKNQEWVMETAVVLIGFKDAVKTVKEIPEPMNAELKKSHALMLKAMNEYQFVSDNLPDAIDNMDAALIEKCLAAFNAATSYLNEATEITKAYIKAN